MSDSIISSSGLPDDIRNEFEVKADGRIVCKSWRALARLAGVSESVFRDTRPGRLLDKILRADFADKPFPKSLEPLRGVDIRVRAEIDEVVMSCFFNYFAYEAPTTTDEARNMVLVFTSIGIRAYFQKELGWQPYGSLPTTYKEALQQLIAVEEQKERVKDGYPGLSQVYEECSQDLLPVPELKANFRLRDWIAYKGLELTTSERKSFGNFVASTVERDRRETLNRGKGKANQTILYNQQHLPLIEECYYTWIKRGGMIKKDTNMGTPI